MPALPEKPSASDFMKKRPVSRQISIPSIVLDELEDSLVESGKASPEVFARRPKRNAPGLSSSTGSQSSLSKVSVPSPLSSSLSEGVQPELPPKPNASKPIPTPKPKPSPPTASKPLPAGGVPRGGSPRGAPRARGRPSPRGNRPMVPARTGVQLPRGGSAIVLPTSERGTKISKPATRNSRAQSSAPALTGDTRKYKSFKNTLKILK